LAIAAVQVVSVLLAEQTGATSEPKAEPDHSATLAKRAARLSMSYADGSRGGRLELLQQPIMRTPNKLGNSDGRLWLWLDGRRPLAALSIWNRGPLWYSENSTLTDKPLQVTGWSNASWRSPSAARQWTVIDDVVPESAAARQRNLRAIALRFTAREDRLGVKSELRLLPRPLYAYREEDQGILDGAVFTFVYGTDPELLMQVEAKKTSGNVQWQAAFARLASAELAVELDEKSIWSAPAISKDDVVKLNTGYCIVREDE
jgi:hypothetical protein